MAHASSSRGATTVTLPADARIATRSVSSLHDKPASTKSPVLPAHHVLGGGTSAEELAQPKKAAFVKELSCYVTLFIAGWNDSSSGPLIPYIMTYYGLTYTVVSMLFVGQAVGFIAAGAANAYLSDQLGLGRTITVGAICQAVPYIFLIPGWPFPLMPCMYAIIGFGMALQDAQANVYVSTLPNIEQRMGILHGIYGFGALVCPLAATAFVSSGKKFSHFYALSFALASVNILMLLYGFKFRFRIEDTSAVAQEIELVTPDGIPGVVAQQKPPKSKLRQALTTRTVWIFCTVICFYVGAEVSMGGWIVSFVIDERQGGPSAGYIASGFWAGLAIGRLILPPLNVRVGERKIVPFYIVLCIALEFAIWFGKSLVGNAVTVAIVGLLLGPTYPIVMSLCTQILPRSLHAASIGFIAALGQVGAAIFPFITGALAQRFSTTALQPVMVVLFAVITGLWFTIPKVEKKEE